MIYSSKRMKIRIRFCTFCHVVFYQTSKSFLAASPVEIKLTHYLLVRPASFLVSAVSSNVSGCEQTVKSIPDRVCDVPLRMLEVPRPELNRCRTRECSA
jgi:hypothetical protein